MTLADYIKSFPRKQRMALRQIIASQLGISEVYVRSMCNGHKKIPGKYAISIERLTAGMVSRYSIAPELYPTEAEGTETHGTLSKN